MSLFNVYVILLLNDCMHIYENENRFNLNFFNEAKNWIECDQYQVGNFEQDSLWGSLYIACSSEMYLLSGAIIKRAEKKGFFSRFR